MSTIQHRFKKPAHKTALLAGLVLFAAPLQSQLVLNEVMASNASTVQNENTYPDWIELYNNSDQTLNLGGMSLSDDPANPRRFVFPANTVLAARSYLIVWSDSETTAPGLHTGFGLGIGGDTVSLYDTAANGGVLRDSVTFGMQITDVSIGRSPNATGAWTLNIPTPALPNQLQNLAPNTLLKINEWLAVAPGEDDWIEVYNPSNLPADISNLVLTDSTGTPPNRPIPALSYMPAQGFLQFFADDLSSPDANHLDFKLGSGGETLTLYAANKSTLIDRVTFGEQASGISQGRLPDGDANIVSFTTRSTPGASNFQPLTNIVINEVLTHSDPPLEDAFELHNPTTAAVDLSGWWLSDNRSEPRKFRVPAGTVIAPGGYTVFYEFQFNPSGDGTAPSFTFDSAEGDELYLFTANAAGALTGFRAGVSFPAAENGVSFGRYETTAGPVLAPASQRTFGMDQPSTLPQFRTGQGLANAAPLVGPLVISEIHYNPARIQEGTNLVDNVADEFIEIQNVSAVEIALFDPENPSNTWRLGAGIEFEFPRNFLLGSGQTLLVVNFDPAIDAVQLASFRDRFSVPAGTPIFGPYSGKLDNAGEAVALYKPDPPQLPPHPNAGLVPRILVDRIDYADTAPWPSGADATGSSLHRIRVAEFGNDPINWIAEAPSPGRTRTATTPPAEVRIEQVQMAGLDFVFRFAAAAGQAYTIQTRASWSEGGWTTLSTIPAGSARTVEFSEPLSNLNRFYRVSAP